MNQDAMSTCPKCGCDGCYKLPINETKYSYYCWGCGFQSNDLMIVGEFSEAEYEEVLPELYKDLKHIDEAKRVWYPITINITTKGTVFAYGTSKESWQWAAIKSKRLTEEQKKEPKYKGADYASNANSFKQFGNDFIEACDYIGVFENQ